MSSIIIAACPVHGHVTPLLTVARGFVERGDDVRFITGAAFADRVTATGAVHIALPPDADFNFDDLEATFPERGGLKGIRAITFDVEHIFANPAKSQYEAVLAAHTARPADVVLADQGYFGAMFLLAHRRPIRPAVVVCGVLPLGIPSADTAPFGLGLPPARLFNRQRNAVLAAMNRRVWSRANDILDRLHRAVHGQGLPGQILNWYTWADAMVQFTVPCFEYPRSDAPPSLHFVGPLGATGSRAPLPDWWGDLDGSRPVVHVTQGTVANKDYAQVIEPALEALANEDVLIAVATGGRPLDTLPPLPANARAAEYLPYDELLPRTDVFVTNGGYGGVQYALRYGVPIVATGGKEDKPEVGARVAWSGSGLRLRTERPTPRALRRAILAALREPRYRQASRCIAAEMREYAGFATLVDVVERQSAGNGSTLPATWVQSGTHIGTDPHQ
ncbi:MAG TPA: glycosyltransferase [Mycobacterium sp.]|uniref:glycosyltransferase n=1 Tax=Mycobacterium sp. TaxID=1785 RepID=UPI002BC989A8|nr:glycosyltransferase [Mycobacterium sp.]HXO83193.1 glycosyltransferase [Mycobacterium sp.]